MNIQPTYSCNDAVLQRMPKGTPIEFLLFYGSPDIMIRHNPIELEEMRTGCVKTKNNKSAAYSFKSMISQQAGQLVCYMYQIVMTQILNALISRKDCICGKGYELYIMRCSRKCISMKITLSYTPLVMSVEVYYGARRTPIVCMALDNLVSVI